MNLQLDKFYGCCCPIRTILILCFTCKITLAGWFAKDPNVLRRVGHVLLQLPFAVQRNPRNIIIADDCFQLSKIAVDRVSQVVIKSTEKLFGSMIFSHISVFHQFGVDFFPLLFSS